MRRKTKLMRVPDEFKLEVDRISEERGIASTDFLKHDGVRILRQSDFLTSFFYGKKKRK